MSDVCLCYATQDHTKMTKLVALFKEEGNLSVSLALPLEGTVPSLAGLVARMVADATVVVMLWSKAASESAFLREMLKHANRDSTLVALLENIEPPPGEEYASGFDLSGWDGSNPKAELYRLRHQSLSWGGRQQLPGPPPADWAPEMRSLLDHARLLVDEANAAASAAPPGANPLEDAAPAPRQWTKVVGPPPAAPTPEPAPAESSARGAGGQGSGGVFISYRRDEASAYAGRLYDRLAARFGKEKVFFDAEDIGWGEDFVDIITAAAESCAVMIALISRGWARGAGGREGTDDYVRLEVATALGRKIRVIPILIQGASMPAPKELSEDLAPLARRNALALSDTRWERDVEDLIKSLEPLL